MQVEYDFYMQIYGGANISEKEWRRLSQKAMQRLQQFTFDRLPESWEGQPWVNQAKCAVCEMAEYLLIQENGSGKASESTDGYSVSYDTGSGGDARRSLYDIARVYLGNTGLLYAGVGC